MTSYHRSYCMQNLIRQHLYTIIYLFSWKMVLFIYHLEMETNLNRSDDSCVNLKLSKSMLNTRKYRNKNNEKSIFKIDFCFK